MGSAAIKRCLITQAALLLIESSAALAQLGQNLQVGVFHRDHPGVHVKAPLGDDHVGKFRRQVDVGPFQITSLNGAHPVRAGRAQNLRPCVRPLGVVVVTHGVQTIHVLDTGHQKLAQGRGLPVAELALDGADRVEGKALQSSIRVTILGGRGVAVGHVGVDPIDHLVGAFRVAE